MDNDDLDWPLMTPALDEEEKDLLRFIDKATANIGFFGATNQQDFIHVIAIAMRMTRAYDRIESRLSSL